MALTYAIVNNGAFEDIWGRTRTNILDVTMDSSYPTNGYVINTAAWGMKTVVSMTFEAISGGTFATGAGFSYVYDTVHTSIRVMQSAGGTPAGTISTPTVTVPTVTVTGGQGAAAALQINPDSAAGVLGKTTATTFTIPGATFGIGAQTVSTPTFTGTATVAAGLVEVTVATNLSAVTVRVRAFGN